MFSNKKRIQENLDLSTSSHIHAIDGLRGLACMMVVMHHCHNSAGAYHWPFGLSRLYAYGALGVEIFFVLSAFCLAYPIYLKFEQPTDWTKYAAHRARRILPPYYSAILALLSINLIVQRFYIAPLDQINPSPPSWKKWADVLLLIGVWVNASFWTLCVEARWYFVLPLLIGIQRRKGLSAVVIITCLANGLCYLIFCKGGHWANAVLFLTSQLPFYLPLFAVGMAAAWFYARKDRTPAFYKFIQTYTGLGLIAALLLVVAIMPSNPHLLERFDYRRLLPGGLTAFFLLVLATSNPRAQRILSWKPLRKVGLFSYSLYLIHLPLIDYCYLMTRQYHWSEWTQFCFYQLIVAPTLVLIGYGFYTVFEKPFLRRKTAAWQSPVTV